MSSVASVSSAAEAAARLGHRSYTGTVQPAGSDDGVRLVSSAAEAAARLGHRSYTGTVQPANGHDG